MEMVNFEGEAPFNRYIIVKISSEAFCRRKEDSLLKNRLLEKDRAAVL